MHAKRHVINDMEIANGVIFIEASNITTIVGKRAVTWPNFS